MSLFNSFVKPIIKQRIGKLYLKKAKSEPIHQDSNFGEIRVYFVEDEEKAAAEITWMVRDSSAEGAAPRIFPQYVKEGSPVGRIQSVFTDPDLEGNGIGTILYLRALDSIGSWVYNSQVYPPAHKLLRKLASQGLIEFYSKVENTQRDAGPNIKRITDKGRQFLQSTIKESIESVASVYGTDGPYDVSDGRTPKVLGPMLRCRKKPRKRKISK